VLSTLLGQFSVIGAAAGGPVIESSGWLMENVWIIPFIPAVAFALIIMLGKKLPKGGAEIGMASILAVFVLSVLTGTQWMSARDKSVPETGNEEAAALVVDVGDAGDVVGDVDASVDPVDDAGLEGEADGVAAPEDGLLVGTGGGTGGTETAQAADAVSGGVVSTSEFETAADADGEGGGGQFLPVVRDWTWWDVGGLDIRVGTMVDGLTVMMLVTVGLVSALVHLFSLEYVKGDSRFTHYYAFLSLFTAAMLLYVVSSSLMQMLVAWELVGLCSFVLIGHWWEDKNNTDASMKAFLTNRVGDIGLLVGVTILIVTLGTSDVLEINRLALSGGASHLVLLVASVCLMAAVASKSGQFPLHTWLPDAMAGPTPVSALIHAATMVVAGVFLIGRLYPVFWEGLSIGTSSFNLMAVMGAFTTIMAGLLAFVQRDVKKVLAYSTVSQLGYMVMALGVGAWGAGMFHLFTHAFFKACLFLGAGALSHACHHSFDMKAEMGGLRKKMPLTFWTFIFGTGALAGVPPLAGFWSKDEILAGAWAGQENGYPIIFVMGCVTAFLTAAYMTRVIYLVFFGEYRGHDTPHDPPFVMAFPLMVLSGLALFAGFFNLPNTSIFEGLPSNIQERFLHYVEPTYFEAFPLVDHSGFIPWIAVLSIFLGIAGIGLTAMYYRKCIALGVTELPDGPTSRNKLAAAGYTFLENKYYLDHLYTGIIAGGTKGVIARATNWFNSNVLDGIVNGVGKTAVKGGDWTYKNIDQGVVDGAVKGSGALSSGMGQVLRHIQTGKVQQYGALLFAGVTVLAAVFIVVV